MVSESKNNPFMDNLLTVAFGLGEEIQRVDYETEQTQTDADL